MGKPTPFLLLMPKLKYKNMRNTKTGKVVVYNPYLIEEMPWYEPIIDEEEAQPEQPQEETAAAEKPKRKNWKAALAEKAQELEGAVDGNKVDSEGNQEAGSAAPAAGDSAGQTDSSQDA